MKKLSIIIIVLLLFTSRSYATVETFSTAGSYSWTVPLGATSLQIEVWGGGGSGGCGSGTGDDAPGGGGGGYAQKTISVTPGNSYTIVVSSGMSSSTCMYDSTSYYTLDYAGSSFYQANTGAIRGTSTFNRATDYTHLYGTNTYYTEDLQAGDVIGNETAGWARVYTITNNTQIVIVDLIGSRRFNATGFSGATLRKITPLVFAQNGNGCNAGENAGVPGEPGCGRVGDTLYCGGTNPNGTPGQGSIGSGGGAAGPTGNGSNGTVCENTTWGGASPWGEIDCLITAGAGNGGSGNGGGVHINSLTYHISGSATIYDPIYNDNNHPNGFAPGGGGGGGWICNFTSQYTNSFCDCGSGADGQVKLTYEAPPNISLDSVSVAISTGTFNISGSGNSALSGIENTILAGDLSVSKTNSSSIKNLFGNAVSIKSLSGADVTIKDLQGNPL